MKDHIVIGFLASLISGKIFVIRFLAHSALIQSGFAGFFKLQYLKKEMSNWLDILPAVRHWWKLQIDFVNFVGSGQACSGMPKVYQNNKTDNISGMSWVIVLIFCIQSDIDGSYELTSSFLLGVVQHVQACSKCSKISNYQYLWKEMRGCVYFLHTFKRQWKLSIDHVIFVGCGQAWPSIPKVFQNNKLPISQQRAEWLFSLLLVVRHMYGSGKSIMSF